MLCILSIKKNFWRGWWGGRGCGCGWERVKLMDRLVIDWYGGWVKMGEALIKSVCVCL